MWIYATFLCYENQLYCGDVIFRIFVFFDFPASTKIQTEAVILVALE